jgi:hypothetical protein
MLESNIVLSFSKLIELSDIVIRPTNADGDSLSIREALYFQKPIIASDVVKRPTGTITFKTRNFDDFMLQLKNCIHQKNENKQTNLVDGDSVELSEFYINLIKQTLNKYLFQCL